MSGPYDDIINLPHPTSQRHPRMPIRDRAAIFSPFAALSGHGAAIAETARLTERRIELGEDTRAELDRRQAILLGHIDEQPEITRNGPCSWQTGQRSLWRMWWPWRAASFKHSCS